MEREFGGFRSYTRRLSFCAGGRHQRPRRDLGLRRDGEREIPVLFAHTRSQWRTDAKGARCPAIATMTGLLLFDSAAPPAHHLDAALEPTPEEAPDPAVQSNDRQYLPAVNLRYREQ